MSERRGAGEAAEPAAPARAPSGHGSPLSRAWHLIISLMNGAGSLWILALMLLILIDVIGRGAFRSPLRGVPELVGLSIVGIVFLQLAHAAGSGRLTRSEAVIDRLRTGWPRVGHLLDALFHLGGAVMLTVIAYIGTPLFLRSWHGAEYVGVAGYFTAPTWPVKLIIVIGSACAAIEFARRAWIHLRDAVAARRGG